VNEPARQRLAELSALACGDELLDAIALAIAVEHSFGVVLADDDITPGHLCSPPALEATVARYMGGA
jgi:hypothetical protein